MTKLIFSLSLIITGLLCGYLRQIQLQRKKAQAAQEIAALRKKLQKIGLLFFMPVSFVTAVWVVSFADIRVALLPFIGGGALLTGGVLGLLAAKLRGMDGKETGTMFCCGSFTNIGSIGALVAFVYLGEAGFGLVALYKMFEETIYYTVGFPVARYFRGGESAVSFKNRMKDVAKDPFVRAAMAAFVCGLALNLSGIARPEFFARLNAFFVPSGTFILLVSIGLGMRFSTVTSYLAEGILIAGIKFFIIPLLAVGVAYTLGLGEIGDGLVVKVVLIAASMPVAFTAMVAASIYDLDLEMANACWLLTTGSLIFTLPLLSILLPLM